MTSSLRVSKIKQGRVFGLVQIKELVHLLEAFEKIFEAFQAETRRQVENVQNAVGSVDFFGLGPVFVLFLVVPVVHQVHFEWESLDREPFERSFGGGLVHPTLVQKLDRAEFVL